MMYKKVYKMNIFIDYFKIYSSKPSLLETMSRCKTVSESDPKVQIEGYDVHEIYCRTMFHGSIRYNFFINEKCPFPKGILTAKEDPDDLALDIVNELGSLFMLCVNKVYFFIEDTEEPFVLDYKSITEQ